MAGELMPQAELRDDLIVRFAEVEMLVKRSLCAAAREWNRTHDKIRVLPLELRGLCWSFLPRGDIYRLQAICTSWRDLIIGTPPLWTAIAVTAQNARLAELFRRSGLLPLHVAVASVRTFAELSHVDDCLRPHASRLITLKITFDSHSYGGPRPRNELFAYQAPVLEMFSLCIPHVAVSYDIPAQLFNGVAPNLRSLTVSGVRLPDPCPALSRLTRLEILSPVSNSEHIVTISSYLECLKMVGLDPAPVPVVPANSALHSAIFEECAVSFGDLLHRGYLRLQHLSFSQTSDISILLEAARHHVPSGETTLTTRGMTIQYLSRRAGGGSMSFQCDTGSMGTVNQLLGEPNVFQSLRRLVLPLEVRSRNYCHLAGDLSLPALQTLAVLLGGERGLCSLFDPGIVRGTINAPLLSRLELLPDPDKGRMESSADPDHIAEFIEQNLGGAAPARIDVFDEAAGRLPPELAQSLEDATSALVAELTTTRALSDDLEAQARAMRTLFAQTIASSFRNWNVAHDRVREFPVELLSMCWSYLPQADLVRLASICSSWRSLSLSIPALWTEINIYRLPDDLSALFARSAQLPLKVSLSVFGHRDLHDTHASFLVHAHRLRELTVTFESCEDWRTIGLALSFRFPAPALEKLSLAWKNKDTAMVISPNIFDGQAPRLHSVVLNGIFVPSSRDIFGGITRLTFLFDAGILADGQTSLLRLFNVCPNLEELELRKLSHERFLPRVPAGSKLRSAALSLLRIRDSSALLDRGYIHLPQLEVSTNNSSILFQVAHYQAPGLQATVSISHTETTTVILHQANGATASFTAAQASRSVISRLLSDGSFLQSIQRLVLPSNLGFIAPDHGATWVYYLIEGELHLPSLRTLAILHGTDGHCSLFDPRVVCGVIVAPRLTRIEISRDPFEGPRAAGPISPSELALFIEGHIDCGDPAALELVADDLLDCGDDDGMESLRRCVGTLVYW
ncbi:hypothetical protein AURDEDRAFT_161719 [Auricularia subglabra TFB-10046 SS5]|nr:hypothetical protein AURDEDRAFT_161719 [Auricularia subglabra TFB-10046 SS5]